MVDGSLSQLTALRAESKAVMRERNLNPTLSKGSNGPKSLETRHLQHTPCVKLPPSGCWPNGEKALPLSNGSWCPSLSINKRHFASHRTTSRHLPSTATCSEWGWWTSHMWLWASSNNQMSFTALPWKVSLHPVRDVSIVKSPWEKITKFCHRWKSRHTVRWDRWEKNSGGVVPMMWPISQHLSAHFSSLGGPVSLSSRKQSLHGSYEHG